MKKIKSTKDIIVNSTLRVYKKGFGYSKLTVFDVSAYYIAANADKDFLENTANDDIIEAYLWVEHDASYEFPLQVIGKFSIDLKIIFFKHTDTIKFNKERKCLMAKVNLPFNFFFFDIGKTIKGFSSSAVKIHIGTIIEISDREAIIKYAGNIEKDSYIKGHISIEGNDIDIIGKAVPAASSSDYGNYKIEFSGMNEKDRNRILDYVFNVYRE
jgi:hypothetical protein